MVMGMREKLIELLDDALLSVNWDSHDYPDTDSAADILIANDVVPVVRCKDCKHWIHMEEGFGECTNGRFSIPGVADITMNAEEFCCLGERKNNG
jgi:hypothetical protein